MYEAGLSISWYLADSIAGSIYMQKFLRGKYQKKTVLFVCTSLYFIFQSLVLDRIDRIYLINDITGMLVDIAFIFLLQMLLYNKDFLKQLYVAVSFVAGKNIIKYIIIVINECVGWVIEKFSAVLLMKITTGKEVEIWSCIIGVTQGLVIILSYILLLIVYFSIISRKFVK